MEKIDILLWITCGGFTLLFVLLILMLNHMNKQFDKKNERFDRIETKVNNIERSLWRLEGTFLEENCGDDENKINSPHF